MSVRSRFHRHVLFWGFAASTLFFCLTPGSRAEETGTGSQPLITSLTVEQSGYQGTVGEWELLMPNQTSARFSSVTHTMSLYYPGNYTLIANPPDGMSAKTTLYKGDAVVSTLDRPQMSFVASEGDPPYRISLNYVLSRTGDVTVTSNPAGVPFELKGPNNIKVDGVTPYDLSHSAVGQYVVQYLPEGCIKPRPQSQLLQKDLRLKFSIAIDCDAFVPPEPEPSDDGSVDISVGGATVNFSDVPQDAWFAPYVYTIVKGGVMSGYKDEQGNPLGQFGPENPVTVGELAKLAHEIAGIDESSAGSAATNPGAEGKWFSAYVASAEVLDWTIFADGTIDLARPATRGEVVVTLLQALNIPLQWQKGNLFTDVQLRTPYAAAIETAAHANLVSGATDSDGKPTGLFHPADSINRAEIAKILSVIIEKVMKKK